MRRVLAHLRYPGNRVFEIWRQNDDRGCRQWAIVRVPGVAEQWRHAVSAGAILMIGTRQASVYASRACVVSGHAWPGTAGASRQLHVPAAPAFGPVVGTQSRLRLGPRWKRRHGWGPIQR